MRYLPLTPDDRAQMLGVIGAASIDDLFADVPAAARKSEPFDLPHHAGELEVERELSARSSVGLGPIATMCRRPWTTSFSARNS